MTIIVGGLRHRLIRDSVFNMLNTSLTALGWFDSGRANQAVTIRTTPVHNDEEIEFNTCVVFPEDMHEVEGEMGSTFGEHSWSFYVDFYAEDDSIGIHFIGDVKDILAGRMSTIGRVNSNVAVYDYTQATPPIVFYVELEDIFVDRASDFPHPWQKHWYACRFTVVDYYGDEAGT